MVKFDPQKHHRRQIRANVKAQGGNLPPTQCRSPAPLPWGGRGMDNWMKYDSQKHHRRSIRLQGYDYTQPGAYFVTLSTWRRVCSFGEVVQGEMRLSPQGQIANREWMRLGRRFSTADFSAFVVMPNHVHGIVVLNADIRGAGGDRDHPNPDAYPLRPYEGPRVISGSLGAIVRAYKASVTWRIHAMRGGDGSPVWQRNYYEHILRDDNEYRQIIAYIQSNPRRWEADQLHPAAMPSRSNQD
jgi:putative transposase